MGYYKDEHKYDDMLLMPHHQSAERPHMSLHDRAAQFSPFAALTGYEAELEETARITEDEICLDETQRDKINEALRFLALHLEEKRKITITYFKQDIRKQGGAYLTDVGYIKKIDEFEKLVIMNNGMKISMEQIVSIEIE